MNQHFPHSLGIAHQLWLDVAKSLQYTKVAYTSPLRTLRINTTRSCNRSLKLRTSVYSTNHQHHRFKGRHLQQLRWSRISGLAATSCQCSYCHTRNGQRLGLSAMRCLDTSPMGDVTKNHSIPHRMTRRK